MTEAVTRGGNSALGLAIMCPAVTLFTCIDTSSKWLILAGMSPVIFLQMVMATIASIGIVSVWPTVWTLVWAAVILPCGPEILHWETATSKASRRTGMAPH